MWPPTKYRASSLRRLTVSCPVIFLLNANKNVCGLPAKSISKLICEREEPKEGTAVSLRHGSHYGAPHGFCSEEDGLEGTTVTEGHGQGLLSRSHHAWAKKAQPAGSVEAGSRMRGLILNPGSVHIS